MVPRVSQATAPWAAALLLASGLCAAPAQAGKSAGQKAEYSPAAPCPEREQWLAALAARVPEREARQLQSQLRVEIEHDGVRSRAYTGRLVAAGSAEVLREVRGRSCAEVLEALALIAVLVRPAPAPVAPDSAGSDGLASSGWTLTQAEALALAEVPSPAPAVRVPHASMRWGLTALTWLGSATRPRPSLDYGLGLTGEWSSDSWQPSLRMAAYTGSTQRARASNGTAQARFQHFAIATAACPWRFSFSATVGLRPCLAFDLGRLSGEGLAVVGARRRSWPWLSTGAELQLAWAPWAGVQLGALLAAVVPLGRPRFYFMPELTSFQVPLLGFRAGAELSWFF